MYSPVDVSINGRVYCYGQRTNQKKRLVVYGIKKILIYEIDILFSPYHYKVSFFFRSVSILMLIFENILEQSAIAITETSSSDAASTKEMNLKR